MALQNLKTSQLVLVHNHLNADAPVNRFSDKEAAVRRTMAALERAAKDGDWDLTAEQVAIQLHPEATDEQLIELLDSPAGQPSPAVEEDAPQAVEQALTEVKGDDRAADEAVLRKAASIERKTRQKRFVFKPMSSGIKAPGEKSRRMECLQLLLRPTGATLEEVMRGVRWTERQAYEGIRLCHYAHGYGLRQDDQGRVYAYEK